MNSWEITCKGQWCAVIGPEAKGVTVVEKSAYDAVVKERDEARYELALWEKCQPDYLAQEVRLKNERDAERARSAKLVEALRAYHDLYYSIAGSNSGIQSALNRAYEDSYGLLKESDTEST